MDRVNTYIVDNASMHADCIQNLKSLNLSHVKKVAPRDYYANRMAMLYAYLYLDLNLTGTRLTSFDFTQTVGWQISTPSCLLIHAKSAR